MVGLVSALVLGASVLSREDGGGARALAQDERGQGFAVVELFTSQGCSSCPPADALLRKLDRAARRAERPVYVLSLHVDYWNRLGWEDPFSDAAYSARQRRYAQTLPSRVYTPQLVVNGRQDVVGSRGREVRQLIARALRREPEAHVRLELASCGRRAKLRHEVSGSSSGAELVLALVERGLSSEVTRGENRGRHLRHTNVVRVMREVEVDARTTALPLEPVEEPRRSSVIAFVQHRGSGHVLGAARVSLAGCAQ